jgi:hypothetical protein
VKIYDFFSDFALQKEKTKKGMEKDVMTDVEVHAAKERSSIPLEIRVKSFRDMLQEKDVNT